MLYKSTCKNCGKPIGRKVPQAPWAHVDTLMILCLIKGQGHRYLKAEPND